MKTDPNYFHLNIGNRWPGFHLHDLEIADNGALQLRALPRLLGRLPENLSALPLPEEGPSGVARSDDGSLFFTEPEKHRVWRIDPCDPQQLAKPQACLGGEGSEASQFRSPRGLLFLPGRGLLIADSGNDRIQILDAHPAGAGQVREIWNGADAAGNPVLHEPWAMAADAEKNVYVVVAGDHSLQKIDYYGRIEKNFRQNVETKISGSEPRPPLLAPVAIAIAAIAGEELVLVLDREQHAIVAFDREGHWQKTFIAQELQAPSTLAVSEQALFIGDNGEQNLTVLQFDLPVLQDEYLNFAGYAVNYRGPVAALFYDQQNAMHKSSCGCAQEAAHDSSPASLFVLPGQGTAPLALQTNAGYRTSGFALAGPFDFRGRPVAWHRLQAFVQNLIASTHLRFFFALSESPTAFDLENETEAILDSWNAFPVDATEGVFESFVSGAPPATHSQSRAASTYLWLGVKFFGEGTASPRITQLRVQFEHASYLPNLPALYSEDLASRQFLLPLLSLFESFFVEQETAMAKLPALFDTAAAAEEFLDWLASWLAQDVEEEWSAERKRRMIAKAFAEYARRGVSSGLRQRLQDFAGVPAHLLEPAMNAELWSLNTTSTLDFDTMLVPAEAQGAVLGTTATLDRSHLITDAEYGAPLFEATAHRFAVMIYPNAASSPERMRAIEAVLERDKPAHVAYHICVIQPAMRVGFQARLGLDTIVGGPASATPLSQDSAGGLVLGGTPLARLGESNRVGVNTQVF